jgi:hypothetical protein
MPAPRTKLPRKSSRAMRRRLGVLMKGTDKIMIKIVVGILSASVMAAWL